VVLGGGPRELVRLPRVLTTHLVHAPSILLLTALSNRLCDAPTRQVVVPLTYSGYTARRVLTTEWLDGEKLSQSKVRTPNTYARRRQGSVAPARFCRHLKFPSTLVLGRHRLVKQHQ
jgi:hypothetical protein